MARAAKAVEGYENPLDRKVREGSSPSARTNFTLPSLRSRKTAGHHEPASAQRMEPSRTGQSLWAVRQYLGPSECREKAEHSLPAPTAKGGTIFHRSPITHAARIGRFDQYMFPRSAPDQREKGAVSKPAAASTYFLTAGVDFAARVGLFCQQIIMAAPPWP
jgi:hypothetical protein